MRLRDLVLTSKSVADVGGRLEKIERLAALLRRTPPEEVEIAVAFLSGALRQGRVGIGWAVVAQAKASTPADSPTVELREVDEIFERMTQISGRGSTGDKVSLLRQLFSRATAEEQDFLIRLIFGELRQGALEGVLIEAVARAARIPSRTIRRVAMMAGGLGPVARLALSEGEPGLSQFIIRLMQPVQPMLAQSADGVNEALGRLGQAALEFKMDGARVQVHKAGDQVKVFSRTLREVTAAVPEVVDAVRALPAREVILDGEVIALGPDHMPHPFQITMRRFGRRLDVERLRQELPLNAFFFDCLYLDGESLLDESQWRRFGALALLAPSAIVIPHKISPTGEQAEAFLDEAIRGGHEGIMAKGLDAPYAAGSRGQAWLKVKMARTLDLVVLAAEWGHGRRRGWLSNLHLGARDPERGGFVMLGKTFKGLTDETLAWQTRKFLDMEIARDDYTVYVRPELVVEIALNDIQQSPHYPGGLALRFARVKRYRADKPAAEADTFATVQHIYQRQTGREPPPRK